MPTRILAPPPTSESLVLPGSIRQLKQASDAFRMEAVNVHWKLMLTIYKFVFRQGVFSPQAAKIFSKLHVAPWSVVPRSSLRSSGICSAPKGLNETDPKGQTLSPFGDRNGRPPVISFRRFAPIDGLGAGL